MGSKKGGKRKKKEGEKESEEKKRGIGEKYEMVSNFTIIFANLLKLSTGLSSSIEYHNNPEIVFPSTSLVNLV